jgi:hypothetical protein
MELSFPNTINELPHLHINVSICHDVKPLIISIIYFPFKINEAYIIPLRVCVYVCVCCLQCRLILCERCVPDYTA